MSIEFNEAFFIELGRNPAIVAVCDAIAETIAQEAIATAPVGDGSYQRSIHVEHGDRHGRHVSLVVADDPKAMIVESRTGNLARAAKRVG